MKDDNLPRLLVFSSLFPNASQPNAGVFIRERMFRVAERYPLAVVSPVPWFPFQGALRIWRPGFRPNVPRFEVQNGIEVFHPRFFSVPGLFKSWDGFFLAASSYLTLRRLKRRFDFQVIDAHFAYPDGYAATLLGRWFSVPVTITVRGTEIPLARFPGRRERMIQAMHSAPRLFSVSDSLKRHAVTLGIPAEKIKVVGNGVDCEKFFPVGRQEARRELNIPENAKVLISVGGLVPRKGFHRVIAILPQLVQRYPELIYLVVGGGSPEGDMSAVLRAQVVELGLQDHVRFLGALPSDQLRLPLSASDVFVLATANEGWANVFLEAMACGLPVVTTDVGGNREVVCDGRLGTVVPYGDEHALSQAMVEALAMDWDRNAIVGHAKANGWEKRVDELCAEYRLMTERGGR
ncbi:glycosyltransferase [Methylococcus sp. EFPC2]|uniref:glycosyltransferase n=1 Tax=Methylococcus sp. EFPC2 TaxID=2812648 RepID=UPI0019672832|nr:glycosyltransferase [Methylococcus sp. EFPC2]QSA98577.1 glycosyltransferase [Methylococcus sp. EFPC2]